MKIRNPIIVKNPRSLIADYPILGGTEAKAYWFHMTDSDIIIRPR